MGVWKPPNHGTYPTGMHTLCSGLILDMPMANKGGPVEDGAAPPALPAQGLLRTAHGQSFDYSQQGNGTPAADWGDLNVSASSSAETVQVGTGGQYMRFPDNGSDYLLVEIDRDDAAYPEGAAPMHFGQTRTIIWAGIPNQSQAYHTAFQLPLRLANGNAAGDPFTMFFSSNSGYGDVNWGSAGYGGTLEWGQGDSTFGGLEGNYSVIALVYNGGSSDDMVAADWRIFVNGAEETVIDGASAIVGDPNRLAIGGDGSGGGNQRAYEGTFDRLRIWNRELSQAEILQEMALPYEIYRPTFSRLLPFIASTPPSGPDAGEFLRRPPSPLLRM